MNSGETQEIILGGPGALNTIHYEPGLVCNKNGEFYRTYNLEEFYSSKIPLCRCEGYCLKESTTWIGIIGIIVIIGLICRYIKKHKKK